MTSRSKLRYKSSGFTLIELLVVMAIFSVIVSFVAPYTMQTLTSTQTRGELIAFEQLIKKWHIDGFYQGGLVEVVTQDNTVSLYSHGEQIEQLRFEHLMFPAQSFVIPLALESRDIDIEVIRRGVPLTLTIQLG